MIIGTCWYLSVLLLLASLVTSAITVAPGHERWLFHVMASGVVGSVFFVATAIFLHTRKWNWIRCSKLAKNLFLGFALLATLCSLPFIVV